MIVTVQTYGEQGRITTFYDVKCDTSILYIEPKAFLDVNGDGKEDVFALSLVKLSKRGMKHLDTLKAYGLQIYTNVSGDTFTYKNTAPYIDYYPPLNINAISRTSFCIIQGISGQDHNRYYCYFEYDKQLKNWFLTKSIVNRTYYDDNFDEEKEKLVEEKHYNNNMRIPFEQVDFEKLFDHIIRKIKEPDVRIHLKFDTVYVYDKDKNKTSAIITKDDDIFKVKEEDNFIYYKQFMEDRMVYGWVRKSDTGY